MKKIFNTIFITLTIALLTISGCKSEDSNMQKLDDSENIAVSSKSDSKSDKTKILIAAAASLEYSFKEKLIPMFTEKYPEIIVEGTYDSSGKLQTQIEEGLEADIFMSAATKQMNELKEKNLIDSNLITELLENKLVLIAPSNSSTEVTSFENITKADTIAIGDPESVPAGQYAKEALTSLGIWEEVSAKSSLGTNVTEVLNWVSEGSAEVGIVYATDASTTNKVKILSEAPEGSLSKKVIYPVGMISNSQNKEEAKLFLDFLQSEEALKIFEEYGFTAN